MEQGGSLMPEAGFPQAGGVNLPIPFAMVNGQIIIFEANACMSFVGARHGGEEYQYLDDYLSAVRRALEKMLVES